MSCDFPQQLLTKLTAFRNARRATSPTFHVWDDILFQVLIPLMSFISRCASWNRDQTTKAKLLPPLFASNRCNYARYMTVMILLMKRLPDDVRMAFEEGLFVAKLSDCCFHAVWGEVTQNKSLKGTGGIMRLTLKGNALARYVLAKPTVAQHAAAFKDAIGTKSKEEKKTMTEKQKWDEAINKMNNLFETSYTDPFNLKNLQHFLSTYP